MISLFFTGVNPHPATRPGATRNRSQAPAGNLGFNPHPATRPGATAHSEPVFFLYIGSSGTACKGSTSTNHRFWYGIRANPPSFVASSPIRGLHDQRAKNVVLDWLAYDFNKL